MTPDRWERVKEIFDLALQRERAQRATFVSDACGTDEALREEVESLLASHQKDGSFIDSPAYQRLTDILPGDQDLKPATEFIDGETLRKRMDSGRLKIAEALNIAEQVASALAEAHRAGIIHRDIKPENIMIRRDGISKVLDFGLAKLTEQKEARPEDLTRAMIQTSAGIVMGTVIYMSPEQARGLPVDTCLRRQTAGAEDNR